MRGKVTPRPPVIVLVVLTLALAFLTAFAATASASQGKAKGPAPVTAFSKAAWQQVIASAKQEGSVVLYTSQNPVLLQDMANKFKDTYGISVTVSRNIDGVTAQQVTAEVGTGKAIADVWVTASRPHVLGALKNGWVVDARGPALYAKTFDRSLFARVGKAVVVGEAVLGMAWNTQQFPAGLKDFPDILNPSLVGRIGIPQPTAAAFVDWYLWLQETYGANILQRLAAMKPKIYLSSLPMLQAVASGEIAASPFVPGTALDLKAQGAPIDFALAKGFETWNAPFFGMVLKQAPHPNAAQLLINYMVTRDGQATSQRLAGTVLRNVPNTWYVKPRVQKLKELTPAKVKEFQDRWDSLFR